MGDLMENKPKALVEIGGQPLIANLVDRFLEVGLNDLVFLLGYKKEMLESFLKEKYGDKAVLTFVHNDKYEEYNNMYSVSCAKNILYEKPFILCNGDNVMNVGIIEFLKQTDGSCVAVDDSNRKKDIDSPKTTVDEKGFIKDLGRHINIEDNAGYAIGLYKFDKDLSKSYFEEIDGMLSEGLYGAGFHDPLERLFEKNKIQALSSGGLGWTDLDCPEDIDKMQKVLETIIKEENKIKQNVLQRSKK